PPLEDGDDVPEDEQRISVQTRGIAERLKKAAFQDEFWAVFDPLNPDRRDPLGSSLSDCLSDIWRDLKPGLEALDADRDKYLNSVVWEWTFSFLSHWGRHAIDA